jgi:hypothetical protein
VRVQSGRCFLTPYTKECPLSQSFLEMAKDLVLAQAGWEGVPEHVWDSAGATVMSQSDHVTTAGDRAADEIVGEDSRVSQGTGEATGADADGTRGWSPAAEDGEEANRGRPWSLCQPCPVTRLRHMGWTPGTVARCPCHSLGRAASEAGLSPPAEPEHRHAQHRWVAMGERSPGSAEHLP